MGRKIEGPRIAINKLKNKTILHFQSPQVIKENIHQDKRGIEPQIKPNMRFGDT